MGKYRGSCAGSDFFFSKLGLDTAFLRRWCPNTNVLLGCWMLHPPPSLRMAPKGFESKVGWKVLRSLLCSLANSEGGLGRFLPCD